MIFKMLTQLKKDITSSCSIVAALKMLNRILSLLRSHIWGLFFCKDSDFARLRGFVCLATNLTIAEAAGRNTRRLAFHQMKSEPIFHP